MDSSYKKFLNSHGGKISEVKLVEANTTGRTYLGNAEEGFSITNFRLHFALYQRHLILSRLTTLIRKRDNYALFEADPTNKVVKRYQIEMLNKNEKKRIESLTDMLYKLHHLPIGSAQFEEEFLIRVNDAEFFQAVFKKSPQLVKYLYSLRSSLIRLSYYPLTQPSIRIVSKLDDAFNPKLHMAILIELTATIASLGQKGYYAKKKSADLRIAKDISLEKDKRKFR
jgi:hypothetical protein